MVPHPLGPRERIVHFIPGRDRRTGAAVLESRRSRVTSAAALFFEYPLASRGLARGAKISERKQVRKEIGGLERIQHRPDLPRPLFAPHFRAGIPPCRRKHSRSPRGSSPVEVMTP